jgi:type II secretory pathway pseudopilin PulG
MNLAWPVTPRRGACPRGFGPEADGRHRAFSLLEMLITLALMIIMLVMFYGFGSRSHQQQQKKACQKNLQKIFVALDIFANEHDGTFPVLPGAETAEGPLALLVPQYSADTSIFICPGSKDAPLPSGESFTRRRISYAYYMGRRSGGATEALMTDRQINTQPKQVGEAVFSTTGKPPGNNHHKYGGNYLFEDGHLEISGTTTPFSLVWTQGVTLLNPKP